MLEALILAPLLINGKVVSQEIPYDIMDLWDKISYYLGFEIDNGCDKIVFAFSDPFDARDCCVEVREKIGTLLFEYLTPLQS